MPRKTPPPAQKKPAPEQAPAGTGEEAGSHILWRGHLKLSLVSCAVSVVPAVTGAEDVSLRTLDRDTGAPLRRQYRDAVTGEPVDADQQAKGHEVAKGRYVTLAEEDFARLRTEAEHTVELRLFVEPAEIDPVWRNGCYYLVPQGKVAVEAYAVIREAMRDAGLAGVGRVVLQRRERRCLVEPWDKGLLMTTLFYPYEVRDDMLDGAPPALDDKTLAIARRMVASRTGPFKPGDYVDTYRQAIQALVKAKQKGRTPPEAKQQPAAAEGKVINIMDALRRSIETERKPAAGKKPSPAKGKGRA